MIDFATVQEYLDLIVSKAEGNIDAAPHKKFWADYASFVGTSVPGQKCHGASFSAIKWIDEAGSKADADNSPLYLILTDVSGFCGKEQMPPSGPFIVDADYSVTRKDGSSISGAKIAADIHEWISGGAPETQASV